MNHIIRRQYFHVAVNGTESAGLALQRSLPDLCRNRLNFAIEQVLERYAPTDGHLYIERLVIDAGTMKLERLEHDLAESVAQALEKSLRGQIPPADASPTITAGNIQHKTTQQTVDEAFLYFLRTGSLPWSFRLPKGSSLEQVIFDSWREAANSRISPRFLNDRIFPALASATVRQRLVRQFSPVFLETLLSLLSPEDKKVIDEVLRVLRNSSVPSVEEKFLEKQLYETAFSYVATGNVLSEIHLVCEAWYALPTTAAPSTALSSMLRRYWPTATNKAPANRIRGTEPISPNNAEPTAPNKVEPITPTSAELTAPNKAEPITPTSAEPTAPNKAEPITPTSAEPTAPNKAKPITPTSAEPTPSKNTEPIPPKNTEPIPPKNIESIPPSLAVSEKIPINISEHPEAGEGIYIENAGLVLLHPFLPQFFTAVDIAAEDKLLQPERALCLLHFLTTGQSIAPEYELVLPKILCNIPLATPVESDLEPTDLENEEVTALLKTVIRHWAVLRNTSPDGLRGTFLLRPGKVSLRDDDWLLQVESNSFDILLDQLPWGISMIKLPWMETILWVEWR